MSESKFRVLALVFAIFFLVDGVISYYLMRKRTEHNISLYTEEGDTILETESKGDIKIWIEESGEPDVWINQEEGGWIRK